MSGHNDSERQRGPDHDGKERDAQPDDAEREGVDADLVEDGRVALAHDVEDVAVIEIRIRHGTQRTFNVNVNTIKQASSKVLPKRMKRATETTFDHQMVLLTLQRKHTVSFAQQRTARVLA